MSEYLKHTLRFFALIAIFPFVVGFIISWLAGLGFFPAFLGFPTALLILGVGSIVWFVRGIKLVGEVAGNLNKLTVLCATPSLLICSALIAWPMLASGRYVGSLSRLFVNRSHYEAIIAHARDDRKSAWFENHGGVTYSVDLGPPVRVAFNPEGFLDNWSGIIYDPTGKVMLVDGFNP